MFIPEDTVSAVKNASDIVGIISEVVMLNKTGRNYVGLCPFHSEKTPSFTVSPDKQMFHCFGCGEGGNVFGFVMKYHAISFPEAVRQLAGRCGIEVSMEKMPPEMQSRMRRQEALLSLNRQAMDFYRRCLLDGAQGRLARAYLKKREMREDVLQRFGVGYAPDSWDGLLRFMSNQGVSSDLMAAAGLAIARKDKPGYYDRFRNRIMFPIMDAGGRGVGFGGRVMDDGLPKYLNSPETPLYSKSRILYGLNHSKLRCRETDVVYIVEGYFDLISMFCHGIENAVATLGTALTPEHVHMLKGYAGRFVLVYDSDQAGIKAALRTVETFRKEEIQGRILVLPSGEDPDSFLMKRGADAFAQIAQNAMDPMTFLMETAIKRHGLSVEGKLRIIAQVSRLLASVDDPVARSLYVRSPADRIGVEEKAVLEKVRTVLRFKDKESVDSRFRNALNERSTVAGRRTGTTKFHRFERKLVAMMLQFPEILPEVRSRKLVDKFQDVILMGVAKIILDQGREEAISVHDLMHRMENDEQRRLAASLAMDEQSWNRDGCLNLINQFEISVQRGKDTLLQRIRTAEEENNQDLLIELLRERQTQARERC
ncbi:MAG: DNA primase [Desulfobacterales bacterium]|nr:DNA primase [Desulfobacterales bacterium]